ncbi:MAG: MG2 domain-containing protein [Clostridium sp.]|nr:MG2 domain-containing protein [Clostridium sp.]
MKLFQPTAIKRLFACSGKPIVLGAVIAAAIAAVLAITISTAFSSRKEMNGAEAAKWIAAYAPEHVDKDSKIRIEMTPKMRMAPAMRKKMKSAAQLGPCFAFSPAVKGEAKLSEDNRFIDFIPAGSLKQGEKYTCRLKMAELLGIDSLGDFKFEFVVDKREMRMTRVVATVDPDDAGKMIVAGVLEYSYRGAEAIDGDAEETEGGGILVCDYPGAAISMGKLQDDGSRSFTISGIKRGEKPSAVKISANPLFGYSKEERTVAIPAISEFRLLRAERVEAAEPYLSLDFSSPLSATQELDGLITIDRVDEARIERDGCNVKIRYPQNGLKELTLRVSDLVKNREGRSLEEETVRYFEQEAIPPAIEMPFEGSILPDNSNLKLPFRAVNLAAVDVEVAKIYPENVMAFLQGSYNGYEEGELRRFGTLIYRKTVRLDKDKTLNLHQWQNFSIDLKGLFQRERGAIYNVRLSFRQAYSLYDKARLETIQEKSGITESDKETWSRESPFIYRYAPDYDWKEYMWKESNDPSKPSYYMESGRMPERNLVASDLGLIAKHGQGEKYNFVVTNLVTAGPAAGATVTVYNYQLRKIAAGKTDGNGFLTMAISEKPYMAAATDGKSTTYLKITRGEELSTSNFDVSGKRTKDGIKGFTYGDRGVWRPGDCLHLTLIVESKRGSLPANHPVVLELYNPKEQLYARQTLKEGVDGFYAFHIDTDENAPTGLWSAQFKVGNQTFRHPVRIETIKPNRLKINIHTPEIIQAGQQAEMGLDAHWLSGPAADGMQVSMEMELYAETTPFPAYKKHVFANPLIAFKSSEKQILSGKLDKEGQIKKQCAIGGDINSPGMLRANLTAKVVEGGGEASIASRSVRYSPFGVYVGIDLSKKDYLTDEDLKFSVVAVNQKGERLKSRQLNYKIYRLDWDWWWEGAGASELDRYVKSTSADLVASGTATAVNGHAEIPFRVEYPNWGRYLVHVRDAKGGHATGGIINVDWPDWRGRAEREGGDASVELSFSLDKKTYHAGETANVYLPKCKGGRALISVENGTESMRRYWVGTSGDKETCFRLPVDGAMAPNFYVHATLLRPHSQTEGKLPIRMYGVRGASVIDPSTMLHPEIDMPEELRPQEQFTIKVREKDGKPMTYTLAIVDEGLLDITNFKTPRPWAAMNQREALGVDTWDMYSNVIGAFGAKFRTILSVGGDEALRKSAGKEKRFNPVVKFIGPFTLKSGANTHKITLPNYVGSVRVMAVAAHQGAYGNADKTVKVTSPLMVLTTLPRILACGDEAEMPVNIFAMDGGISDVKVTVEATGPAKLDGAKAVNLKFVDAGEKMVNFRIKCDKAEEGKTRIIVKAESGNHRMADTTYISVKNPMPQIISTKEATLRAGESKTLAWDGAESARLQISAMPAINFGGAAEFFMNYPHNCTEQMSSKAIFILCGREFLSRETRGRMEALVPTLVNSIAGRQQGDGGFAYWPRQEESNKWVTSLAGIALSEAERQGFKASGASLEKWAGYQEKAARDYRYSKETDVEQAFRLYSLSKAGRPMKSAMNRLRESKTLTQTAAYCLASAYALYGRKDVAGKLIERAERIEYSEAKDMFGSETRDEAMKMEAYALCGNAAKAIEAAGKIAKWCGGGWYVTQDLAFSAIAMHRMEELIGGGEKAVKITQRGKAPVLIQGIKGAESIELEAVGQAVEITNAGEGSVELSLAVARRPQIAEKVNAEDRGMRAYVTYTDLKGRALRIDRLKQGTEFYACVNVKNQGGEIEDLALTYAIPSGWEICGVSENGGQGWTDIAGMGEERADDGYCDVRDDRASFYGRLDAGKRMERKIKLRAAYCGEYLLPPALAEDMYNPSRRAMTSSAWVKIEK